MPRCSVFEGRNAISHTNRNFVLAYIFLVGLPLLGLVAVLKSGKTLSAPFSVDGAWKIEAIPFASSACTGFLSSISNAPLAISQSGKSLVVGLNNGSRTAAGSLDGKTISAEFASSPSGRTEQSIAECGDGGLTLHATLDPMTEPRSMNGTISMDGCSSCAPLEFHAARQPKSPGGTR